MTLSVEEIEERFAPLKSVVPSVVLERIIERIRDEGLSEEEINALIQHLRDRFTSSERRFESLERKLERIENMISFFEDYLKKEREGRPQETSKQPSGISEISKEDAFETTDEQKSSALKTTVGEKEEETPRLKKIENSLANEIVLMKWIEFMIERVGRENLPRLLEYYVDIKWISEDVLNTVLNYARGFSSPKESYEVKRIVDLNSIDHIRSLLFIERLRGNCINRALLLSLEREIGKILEESQELYGI